MSRTTLAVVGWCVLTVAVLGGSDAMPQGSSGGVASDASRSPVHNVWEYAIIHDRTGLGPRDRQPSPPPANYSPCLWSIVQCCRAPTTSAKDSCFEALGCPGAWFDDDLCRPQYLLAAQREVFQSFVPGLTNKLG